MLLAELGKVCRVRLKDINIMYNQGRGWGKIAKGIPLHSQWKLQRKVQGHLCSSFLSISAINQQDAGYQ